MINAIMISIACLAIISFILYIITSRTMVNLREVNKLVDAGQMEKAKNLLQRALYKKKFNPDAHFLMARVYFAQSLYDYSQVEIKSIIKNEKYGIYCRKDELYDLLADSYLKQNKTKEAYNHFLSLANSTPEEYHIIINLGKISLALKQYEKGIDYFQKALDLRSADADAMAGLGMAYFNMSAFDKARDLLDQAVKIDRKNFQAHYYLGLILQNKQLFDMAIAEFERAQSDKNLKLQSLYNLARCNQAKEVWTKAIQYYEEALKIVEQEDDKLKHDYNKRMDYVTQPLILDIRYQLAEVYQIDRNFAAAIDQWQEIESVSPGYRDVSNKIKQNIRYGKDRIQDFLIFKEIEFQKVSRYMIQYLGYMVKKLDMVDKEEILALVQGSEVDVFPGQSLIMVKRGFNPVGEREVERFFQIMKKRNIERGIIISAKGISPNAIRFALDKPVEFVGKNQVMRLLKKYEYRI
ncbi:MAG: tetratricopeptide repeat protein [Spirochaetes bacterium]|nr:tetratricopeptide repeat protein [Spirochaetota bacterium]